MMEIIEEIFIKWEEHFEMCPEEARWEMMAKLLAGELEREREKTCYLRRLHGARK